MCLIFQFFHFYYPKMRRKLWPKTPDKESVLHQMSKIFQFYFIHINYFKKPNKKIYNRPEELYCDAPIFIFWFLTVYLSKKNGNWKMAQGCRLSLTCTVCGHCTNSGHISLIRFFNHLPTLPVGLKTTQFSTKQKKNI